MAELGDRRRELAEMNTDALEQQLAEAKAELFNLRFQHATGQLDNITRLGAVKRDIARIHTHLRAREIAEAEALAAREA